MTSAQPSDRSGTEDPIDVVQGVGEPDQGGAAAVLDPDADEAKEDGAR